MKTNTELVTVISDTHVNSLIGLMTNKVRMDDGGAYLSSKSQRWIYGNFKSFCRDIDVEKRRLRAPNTLIINGDISDDNNHKTTQILTHNKADILKMTVDTLMPIIELADHVIVTRGTEAHVGSNACMDEMVAEDISAHGPAENMYSWWAFRGEFGGVKFDVAHHPGTFSGMPHTQYAPAGRVAARIAWDYALNSEKPPDVAIRSHNHVFADSGYTYPTRAFITYPWQLTTSYGHRKGFSGRVMPIGGMFFVCEAGKYDMHVRSYSPKRGRYWTIHEAMDNG